MLVQASSARPTAAANSANRRRYLAQATGSSTGRGDSSPSRWKASIWLASTLDSLPLPDPRTEDSPT